MGVCDRGTASVAVALLMALVSACGGRVANEVQAAGPNDRLLTCDHLEAERTVNLARMADLVGERRTSNDNNAGMIAGAVLVPAYILFLDFSDTEKKEAEALVRRNETLESLIVSRSCGAPVDSPTTAGGIEKVS
jgi:hypothetical protein